MYPSIYQPSIERFINIKPFISFKDLSVVYRAIVQNRQNVLTAFVDTLSNLINKIKFLLLIIACAGVVL